MTCPITMEQIEYPKELECKHVFESHAIEQWLIDNNTCPVCRFQVYEKKVLTNTMRHNMDDEHNTHTRFGYFGNGDSRRLINVMEELAQRNFDDSKQISAFFGIRELEFNRSHVLITHRNNWTFGYALNEAARERLKSYFREHFPPPGILVTFMD